MLDPTVLDTRTQALAAMPRGAADVVDLHGEFVWRTLQRLGIPNADLEDVFQEVLIVVHRQLGTFEGRSKMTTWLYSVCLRVASTHRRRAWFRREQATETMPDSASSEAGPEELVSNAQERRALREILDLMEPEKRAVFVMFELDELPCEEIAEIIGAPRGTVHSRLHAARHEFQSALRRWQASQEGRTKRRSLWPFGRSS